MGEFTPDTIKLQGKDYLEVAQRVLWLRTDHADAQIVTDLITHDVETGYALFRAVATIPSTGGTATGWGAANRKDLRGPVAANYVEKAETKAIGRACAGLGYGTLAALQEDGDTLADAPVERRPAAPPRQEPAPDAPRRDPQIKAAMKRYADAAKEAGHATPAAQRAWAEAHSAGRPLEALSVADWDVLAGSVVRDFMDGPTRTWDHAPMAAAEAGETP